MLHTAPPAYLPQEDSARCAPREHSASLCTKRTRFDIIAVLYTCTTVAHAPPPTRAPHIYVYSPSPVLFRSCLKSPRLFGEEVLLPYGLVTIAFRYLHLSPKFLSGTKRPFTPNPRMLGPTNPTVSYSSAAPFEPKGRRPKSPDFVPIDRGSRQGRPRLPKVTSSTPI